MKGRRFSGSETSRLNVDSGLWPRDFGERSATIVAAVVDTDGATVLAVPPLIAAWDWFLYSVEGANV